MQPKSRKSIWWGTLTLTSAALASRGLGLIYRMLLARFLGGEGLGLFQMVFPFYVALVTLAVAGTPIAVSQMLAEGKASANRLLRVATLIVLTITLPLMALVIVWAKPLAVTLYHDEMFVPMLWAISPALLAVAFSSVLRGYFLGRQEMEYPAAAQVAEQLARVAILFALLNLVSHHLFPNPPLIAVLLIPLGEAVSLAILAYGYLRRPPEPKLDDREPQGLARAILKLSIPVTLSRLLGSGVAVVEASLIPLRLQISGMSRAAAVRTFGQLTGMALPLILFPSALTVSLSTNLIPAIAEASAHQQTERVHKYIVDSIAATALLTIPVTFVLLTLGLPLDDLFFHASVPSTVFIPLVIGGFFLYFDIAFAGILRGLGRTDLPLWNDLVASLLEIALIWILAGHPGRGREGIAIAVAAGFAASCLFNLYYVLRLTRVRLPWGRIFGRPAMAAFPIWLATPLWQAWLRQWHVGQVMNLFSSVLVACALYFLGLAISGTRLTRLL
ncbi:putative polysaccharide biosynthesis protein [Sulfobacillus harzensis]|uniref:Polysaccharide biosynthesis protein n=1 Tax=Sulfobacillus harzensis TaxID=2729629 RepID=A0A7Y0L696_9FIRM|nr:polysaccharide biosynthesis protein [Sulfobacillus harzensis]NMP24006.1 polysaccharide biosynthesis protein [Sulfobacillus harzensis]